MREEGRILEEWLYLQSWGENRGKDTDGEKGERVGMQGRREPKKRYGSGTIVRNVGRIERKQERQVVMNVLLFKAGCLHYGCVCIHVGGVALGHLWNRLTSRPLWSPRVARGTPKQTFPGRAHSTPLLALLKLTITCLTCRSPLLSRHTGKPWTRCCRNLARGCPWWARGKRALSRSPSTPPLTSWWPSRPSLRPSRRTYSPSATTPTRWHNSSPMWSW